MYLHDCSRTVPNYSIAAEQFRIIRTWVRNKAYSRKIIEKRESAKRNSLITKVNNCVSILVIVVLNYLKKLKMIVEVMLCILGKFKCQQSGPDNRRYDYDWTNFRTNPKFGHICNNCLQSLANNTHFNLYR